MNKQDENLSRAVRIFVGRVALDRLNGMDLFKGEKANAKKLERENAQRASWGSLRDSWGGKPVHRSAIIGYLSENRKLPSDVLDEVVHHIGKHIENDSFHDYSGKIVRNLSKHQPNLTSDHINRMISAGGKDYASVSPSHFSLINGLLEHPSVSKENLINVIDSSPSRVEPSGNLKYIALSHPKADRDVLDHFYARSDDDGILHHAHTILNKNKNSSAKDIDKVLDSLEKPRDKNTTNYSRYRDIPDAILGHKDKNDSHVDRLINQNNTSVRDLLAIAKRRNHHFSKNQLHKIIDNKHVEKDLESIGSQKNLDESHVDKLIGEGDHHGSFVSGPFSAIGLKHLKKRHLDRIFERGDTDAKLLNHPDVTDEHVSNYLKRGGDRIYLATSSAPISNENLDRALLHGVRPTGELLGRFIKHKDSDHARVSHILDMASKQGNITGSLMSEGGDKIKEDHIDSILSNSSEDASPLNHNTRRDQVEAALANAHNLRPRHIDRIINDIEGRGTKRLFTSFSNSQNLADIGFHKNSTPEHQKRTLDILSNANPHDFPGAVSVIGGSRTGVLHPETVHRVLRASMDYMDKDTASNTHDHVHDVMRRSEVNKHDLDPDLLKRYADKSASLGVIPYGITEHHSFRASDLAEHLELHSKRKTYTDNVNSARYAQILSNKKDKTDEHSRLVAKTVMDNPEHFGSGTHTGVESDANHVISEYLSRPSESGFSYGSDAHNRHEIVKRLLYNNDAKISGEHLKTLSSHPNVSEEIHSVAKNRHQLLAPDSFHSESVNVKHGMEKLRGIRDKVESLGGAVHKRDFSKHGINENYVKGLWDSSGILRHERLTQALNDAPSEKWNVSHSHWTRSIQKHTPGKQNVFQLNYTNEHLNKMKEAGVHDTFNKIHGASIRSGHPVTPSTVGWVRWNGNKKGIHIDEIQSDLGKNLNHALDSSHLTHPDRADELKALKPNVEKIQHILWGKSDNPEEKVLEGFHEWARGKFGHGVPIHMNTHELKREINANYGAPPISVYTSAPKAVGYEHGGSYGDISPQKNPAHAHKPTLRTILAKSDAFDMSIGGIFGLPENLVKTPLEGLSNVQEEHIARNTKDLFRGVRVNNGDIHVKTESLGGGLWHHHFIDNREEGWPLHVHGISHSADPSANLSAYVSGDVDEDKDKPSIFTIRMAAVHPEHRGGGLGVLAYKAAARSHHQVHSDATITPKAHEAWNKIKADPQYKVKFGRKGDVDSFHVLTWKGHNLKKYFMNSGWNLSKAPSILGVGASNVVNNVDRLNPIRSDEIGDGLYHHVYCFKNNTFNRQIYSHILSRDKDPRTAKSIAEIRLIQDKGRDVPRVTHSHVVSEFKGSGFGKKLYDKVLNHHRKIKSDVTLTPYSQKIYDKYAEDPAVEVDMAPISYSHPKLVEPLKGKTKARLVDYFNDSEGGYDASLKSHTVTLKPGFMKALFEKMGLSKAFPGTIEMKARGPYLATKNQLRVNHEGYKHEGATEIEPGLWHHRLIRTSNTNPALVGHRHLLSETSDISKPAIAVLDGWVDPNKPGRLNLNHVKVGAYPDFDLKLMEAVTKHHGSLVAPKYVTREDADSMRRLGEKVGFSFTGSEAGEPFSGRYVLTHKK